jgi:hypothetical protein
MTSQHRSLSARARVGLFVVVSVAGSLLMAGCGMGTSPLSTGAASAASFGGKINGGPNPIIGAKIRAYVTGDSYGTGTFVQEANPVSGTGGDTGFDGTFNFAGGYSCPAGRFLYIVSNGGFTGGSQSNARAVLVAAVGRCDDLFSGGTFTGGFIYVNEASTVAAAYALNGFASISTDGLGTVGIGAPVSNNAATGCVAGTAGCASTAAAGLRHAFQNANNLVSVFSPSGNSVLAGGGRVPLQLINSIANVVVACVNSDGSSAACVTLLNATGANTSTGTTFQALLNLAANPNLHGTGVTPTQFFAAATPQTSFYQPHLTAAPADYSIAITYPKFTGAGATNGITFPNSGTLDINDNYLVGNYDSATPTSVNAISFNTSGLVSITTPNTTDIDGNGASADAIGNLFLVGYSPSVPAASITIYNVDTPSGTISTSSTQTVGSDHLISSAVDRQNNLWFGSQLNPTIAELPLAHQGLGFSRGLLAPVTAVAIDPNQNVWVTTASTTTANALGIVQNTGTAAAPTYSSSNFLNVPIPSLDVSGVSFVSGTASPYIAFVGNSTGPGFTKATPALNGALVTSVVVGSHVATTPVPVNNQSDGAGTIWAGASTSLLKFQPTGSVVSLTPCTFATTTSNTTCSAGAYTGLQSVSIDAAGSVWFSAAGSGTVSQVIGAAAPTWPLKSLGLLVKP